MPESFFEEVELTSPRTKTVFADKKRSPFSGLTNKFAQISGIHARSFIEMTISGKALWEDEFGNKFMEVDLKGRLPKDQVPYLEIDNYSESGVRTHGLCDTSDVVRTTKVSRVMRENGLPTERIRRKSKIRQLQVGDEYLEMDEVKKKLFNTLTEKEKQNPVFKRYLDILEFFEVEREMPVGERFGDLRFLSEEDGEKTKKLLKPTFKYLKLVEKMDLDENSPEDLKYFFTEVLPTRMGNFLGKFHKLGFFHFFAGAKNWILTGSLIDLDSVRGTLIGDKAPSEMELIDDFDTTVNAVGSIFQANGYDFIQSLWGKNSEEIAKARSDAILCFIRNYAKERVVSLEYLKQKMDKNILWWVEDKHRNLE